VIAFLQGREPEAIRLLEETRRTGSRAYADSYLGQAYFYAGDTLRSLAILDSLSRFSSAPAAARARATLASFLAYRGDRTAGQRLIEQVLSGAYMDHHVAYGLAVAYAQLGRLADARMWLDRSVTQGFACYPWFIRDPLLAPLRRDPDSRPMLERLQAQWEALKTRYG
jgi:Flp pilus assembly protein TadD